MGEEKADCENMLMNQVFSEQIEQKGENSQGDDEDIPVKSEVQIERFATEYDEF